MTGKSGRNKWHFQAKLAELRDLAIENDLPKTGNVEQLRAKLIGKLILGHIDLTDSGIKSMQNSELTEVLGIFGVKKSGSKKSKMQRLWLHLNGDPKKLNISTIGDMTREQLHAYCISLDLPRSGNKNVLMGRVAGELSSEEKAWGRVKKSLRTGKKVAQPATTPTIAPVEIDDSVSDIVESDVEEIEDMEIPITLDEGAGEALVWLDARRAELTSHLREFLLIGREQDEGDVAAFIEDLGRLGFGIEHAVVRERVLDELQQMIKLKQQEDQVKSTLPGSWREKQALRHLENVRPQLLDK